MAVRRLPLGGVFLGQADGPLLELARIGGPLLLTAGVWAGGRRRSGDDSPTSRAGARRAGSTGRPPSAQPRSSSGSSHSAVDRRRGARRRAGCPVRHRGRGAGRRAARARQGAGLRRPPSSPPRLRATRPLLARHDRPHSSCGPKTSSPSAGPLRAPPRARSGAEAGRLHTTLVAGVTEPASADHVPQRDRGLGTRAGASWAPSRRSTGSLSASTCPSAPSSRISPTCRRSRPMPSPGTAPASCATPAGPLGTLVSFEVFYADRSRTSVRAGAELLIVPTNTSSYAHLTGADAGGGGGRRPGRRDRARPRAGRPDRLQRGRHQRGRRPRTLRGWAGARCCPPPCAFRPGLHALRPLG